ncbi:MAG TPA: PD-(D/E)XK nuclease family protein, partial [Fimbriimonadaceae bacterium]|nr:PD-(D/E)XK nuclease family protein [Fimbriimonadaceae bacterium]
DRLAEWDDGTLEIIDYKSQRGSVSEEGIKNDLALGCYQLLVRQHYPGRRVVASLHALSPSARATYGFNDDDLAEFNDDLQTVGRLIVGKNWEEVFPVKKPICERCDFVVLCKRDPRFSNPE